MRHVKLAARLVPAAALALVMASAPVHAAPDWGRLVSPSQGVAMPVPWDLVQRDKSDPENGQFALRGDAQLVLNLAELDGRSLDGFLRENLLKGIDVTYRRRKGNWMAYSGYFGDYIVYGRTHLSCGGRYAHSFLLRYPRSERATYDRVVERMSLNFGVQPGFEQSRCG